MYFEDFYPVSLIDVVLDVLPFEVLNGVTGCYLPVVAVPDEVLARGDTVMNSRLYEEKVSP